MCDLDTSIPDEEKTVRAIKTPFHIKSNGTLKHNALRPPAEETAVSVIRHAMGDDFCKDKGREVVGEGYLGLLTLPSGQVRRCGSNVLDYRDNFFCGHAHVDHGIPVPPKNEPMAPEHSDRLVELCKAILRVGTYHADPAPPAAGWSGNPL